MNKLKKIAEVEGKINKKVHFLTEIQSLLISLFLNFALITISYYLCFFATFLIRYRPFNVVIAVMFAFMTIHLIIIVKNYFYFELLGYKNLLTAEQLLMIKKNKNNYWYIKYLAYAIFLIITLFSFNIV